MPPWRDSRERSASQKLLDFLEEARPRSSWPPSFGLHVAYRLHGPIDSTLLRQRNAFGVAESFEQRPVSIAPGQTAEAAIGSFLAAERNRPIAPSLECPIRVVLGSVTSRDHVLCLTVHCSIADGGALRDLIVDLERRAAGRHFYQQAATAPKECSAPPSADTLEYWKQQLRGASLPTASDLTFRTPTEVSAHTEEVTAELEPSSSDRLREWASNRRLTPFVALLAGWVRWTSAQIGPRDFLVPTITLAKRAELDHPCLATFLNVILLRSRMEEGTSFAELSFAMRDQVLDALDHELPLAELLSSISGLPEMLSDQNKLFVPIQYLGDLPPSLSRFGPCSARSLARCITQNAGFSLPFDALVTMKWYDGRYKLLIEHRTSMLSSDRAKLLIRGFRDWMQNEIRSLEAHR